MRISSTVYLSNRPESEVGALLSSPHAVPAAPEPTLRGPSGGSTLSGALLGLMAGPAVALLLFAVWAGLGALVGAVGAVRTVVGLIALTALAGALYGSWREVGIDWT